LSDVRGYSVQDAQRTLQGLGFAVTVVRKFDNSPKDNVIDQRPRAGTKVRQGSRITLIASNGAVPVTVPNFVGMTVQSAQTAASKAGLTLDTSQRAAVNGVPADTIASQNPSAGQQTQKAATIFAVVSTGVQSVPAGPMGGPPPVGVPAVTGRMYQDAVDALTRAGFRAQV